MSPSKTEPEVVAVQRVFEALKPLDPEGQQRVLSAALALLGMSFVGASEGRIAAPPSSAAPLPPTSARRKGLTELLGDKKPGTSSQRIVLFAYYRDRHENIATFSRSDLRPYFAKAKLTPPGNYDRDFSTAVERGWIHEDGSDSYLTQKGGDLVESNFEGERSYGDRTGAGKPSPKVKRRAKR